jgi:hypothetical protein
MSYTANILMICGLFALSGVLFYCWIRLRQWQKRERAKGRNDWWVRKGYW